MTQVNDRSTFCPRCGERMEMSPSKSLQICVFCGWSERTANKSDEVEARREVQANKEQAAVVDAVQDGKAKFMSKAEERRYNRAQEDKKKRASVRRLDK